MSNIIDKDIGDLLRTTLTDMYGVKVWWDTPGVYHIKAGGKEATVTSREVMAQQTSIKGLVGLLEGKLELSYRRTDNGSHKRELSG